MVKGIIETFEDITRYPLQSYLDDFISFAENDMINITNYYDGKTTQVNSKSFDKLNKLLKESNRLSDVIAYNNTNFPTYDYWELCDEIDEIKTKLQTIDNYSKWARSSITRNNFSPSIEVEYTLGQNQTLESLANEVGYWDAQNDWVKIAQRNNVEEEDYTIEGGNILQISFRNVQNYKVLSVVDNLQGKSIFGKDIYRKFTIENSDLKVLGYDDTLNQTIDIVMGLRQGDNPEYPSDGIQESLVVGTNLGSISFPSLFRQLFQTIAKEDSLKSLAITKIEQKDSYVKIECTIETKLNDVLITKELIV